jgi:hypothetical protein
LRHGEGVSTLRAANSLRHWEREKSTAGCPFINPRPIASWRHGPSDGTAALTFPLLGWTITPTLALVGLICGFSFVNWLEPYRPPVNFAGLFLIVGAAAAYGCAFDVARLENVVPRIVEGRISAGKTWPGEGDSACETRDFTFHIETPDRREESIFMPTCEIIDYDYFSGRAERCPDANGGEGRRCLRTYRDDWAERQVGRTARFWLSTNAAPTDQWPILALTIEGKQIVSMEATRSEQEEARRQFLFLAGLALVVGFGWLAGPRLVTRLMTRLRA